MPRASRKNDKPDPDGIYVAWQAGSADIDGITYAVTTGEQRRGNDPMVQAHPWLFVPDGTPEHERPNAFGHLVERREAERAPVDFDVIVVHEPTPLEAHEVRVLSRAIVAAVGVGKDKKLVQLEKGQVFAAGSEIVGAIPDAFEADPTEFTTAKRRRR